MLNNFRITGLIFWVILCVAGAATAQTTGTVALSLSKTTALPGEELLLSVTPSDITSFYAVKPDFGGLIFNGVHTADNYENQIFVKITPESFTIEAQLPLDAPAGTIYDVNAQYWSDPDDKINTKSVSITVSGAGIAANAGPDIEAPELSVVRLDGTSSTGDIVSYQWTQLSGPAVEIAHWPFLKGEFTAHACGEEGQDYSFQLTVEDDSGNTSADTVSIHINDVGDTYKMGYDAPLYNFDPLNPPSGWSSNYMEANQEKNIEASEDTIKMITKADLTPENNGHWINDSGTEGHSIYFQNNSISKAFGVKGRCKIDPDSVADGVSVMSGLGLNIAYEDGGHCIIALRFHSTDNGTFGILYHFWDSVNNQNSSQWLDRETNYIGMEKEFAIEMDEDGLVRLLVDSQLVGSGDLSIEFPGRIFGTSWSNVQFFNTFSVEGPIDAAKRTALENANLIMRVRDVRMGRPVPETRHFIPAWTGNPYNSMNLWLKEANLDDVPLEFGDEIAVFDGEKCVGVGYAHGEISDHNILAIVVSQDDGTGNGFTQGNEIAFKYWDASEHKEISNIRPEFLNIETGESINSPTFTPNEDYGLVLSAHYPTVQEIQLQAGWNVISSYVLPSDANLKHIAQPLIDAGKLVKIYDETGSALLVVLGEWENEIGELSIAEGYKINVSENVSLFIEGEPAQPPVDIPLTEGWNIMGHPYSASKNGMTVIEPLMSPVEILKKVIDESGMRIIKAFGSWVNEIGNFEPGKGYQIKVSQAGALQRALSSRISHANQRNAAFFTPVWEGNPFNPMNLRIAAIENLTVQSGDEIGVYDGDKCVGVGVVDGKISEANMLKIAASQDDGTGNGFTEGNEIIFKIWSSDKDCEIDALTAQFLDIATGDPVGTKSFEKDSDYGVILKFNAEKGNIDGKGGVRLQDAILGLQIPAGLKDDCVYIDADVDGDQQITLKDMIYIFQIISE